MSTMRLVVIEPRLQLTFLLNRPPQFLYAYVLFGIKMGPLVRHTIAAMGLLAMRTVYTIVAGIHIVAAGMCLGFDLMDQMQQALPITSTGWAAISASDASVAALMLYLTSSHHDHFGSGSIYGIVIGAGVRMSMAGEGQGKPGRQRRVWGNGGYRTIPEDLEDVG
ncbi:hypothetical protein HETIRDRAFT_426336 [Heterobasidion irregulare TC 32-1]|uniref:Uncharacterized protein n=1 Tax=Heterobasidion irregulare (strain TC 32-1) TaxID=747525 RepID=W4KAH6_HETIT|nr:uncharacterized protein HETIRDRAFT_426336 [Heterobasidion irregulare TC 32-1]ETW82817.1 hypothetical protein HETIRDRAFT_426336 [Heterobasidion irregulare TC 32-1]